MGLDDWNWKLPPLLQSVSWDCAATSVAWSLQAMALPYTEADVVSSMYPTYLNETYGLLDSSGAGIVEWLASIGVSASNDSDATFQEVFDAAGYQPMVIGGRAWNHWVAVRIPLPTITPPQARGLLLMNPAPGYHEVWNWLGEWDFDQLGPFSAVWMAIP